MLLLVARLVDLPTVAHQLANPELPSLLGLGLFKLVSKGLVELGVGALVEEEEKSFLVEVVREEHFLGKICGQHVVGLQEL